MYEATDRRIEKRLRYHWPVWFAENFDHVLSQGQMIDISSGGAAFTCSASESPYPGQSITTRFSVPIYAKNNSFDIECYVRTGTVCRVEQMNPYVQRISLQFAEMLPFKPGEQSEPVSISEISVVASV